MKESRAEAETGGDVLSIADQDADRLERIGVLLVAFDVGEQRAIIASLDALEMRLEDIDQRAGLAERLAVLVVGEDRKAALLQERLFLRQLSGLLIGGGQLFRLDLAGLDIRLIERIDAEDRARAGGGELPAEELLADVIAIGDR